MSQNANDKNLQDLTARRGRVGAVAADALNHAASAFQRAGFSDLSLVTRWPDIAGEAVAAVAEPVKLVEGAEGAVLTLRCEAGAAVFLQHETRALLNRVNAFMGSGRISRIRLVPGTLARVKEPPHHPGLDRKPLPEAEPGLAAAIDRLSSLRRQLKE